VAGCCFYGNEPSASIISGSLLDSLSDDQCHSDATPVRWLVC
jgi:hypothetical protein